MTTSIERQIEADVQREIAQLPPPAPVRRKQAARCRVCSFDESRNLVNKMLAHGHTLTDVLEVVELSVNPKRAKNAKITYESIQNHSQHHFSIDKPAQAAYRKILARRQAEDDLRTDGIARMITAIGFLDVVAQKGYETLVDDNTKISPQLGMEAAVRLHNLTKKDANEQEVAELKHQLAIIKSAVKEVVPQEYWGEIVERIEDAEARMGPEVVDAEIVEDDDYDDDDGEGYSPPIDADVDDSLENY